MNREVILGLARHALTAGGGVLVTRGLVDAGQLDVLAGAAVTVLGVLWSVWDKRSRQAK